MAEARWYVVHTYSGYENKVKSLIETTVENRKLEDQILEVLIPMETATEEKNGVKKQVERKIFPGYVLIHMIMNNDTWYVVRNTRGVTGFAGPGGEPTPLSEEDMKTWGMRKTDEIKIDFEVGDLVVVTDGPWKDTTSKITALNPNKKTVTISAELFGRETPVEISFADVKKTD